MKTRTLLSKISAGLLLASSLLLADPYVLDGKHSSVEFKVKHMAISNVSGNFSVFDGHFDFDPAKKSFNALEGVVEIDSINTGIEKRDEHLKSDDFFDAAKHPKMTFKMTKYEANGDSGKMSGELTIRGKTLPVVFDTEIGGIMPKDRNDKPRVGFTLSSSVNRHDFGLKWNNLVEGLPAVGDMVKITVEIQGVHK